MHCMLSSNKDLSSSLPPFLLQSPDGDWKLVTKVNVADEACSLQIIEKKDQIFSTRTISQDAPAFYVGADVWELDYGASLMTLKHASLVNHPANLLWQQWLEYSKTNLQV